METAYYSESLQKQYEQLTAEIASASAAKDTLQHEIWAASNLSDAASDVLLSNLEQQFNELEEKIDSLHWELFELIQKRTDLEKEQTAQLVLSNLKNLCEDNSIFVHLEHDTMTTPITEVFLTNTKQYLVFTNLFFLSHLDRYVSLIITTSRDAVACVDSGLTMTNLKKSAGAYISSGYVQFIKKTARVHPLFTELLKLSVREYIDGEIVPFEKICCLGSQRYKEQSGFSWEKEYGLTNKLLIVGVKMERGLC